MEVLSAKFEYKNDILKITLAGEIDHHSAKDVREEIDREIYMCRASNVFLDLKNVNFMDSSGLGLVLGRYSHVKETGGSLKVLNPCVSAERVLKLAGAEKIIPIIYEIDI